MLELEIKYEIQSDDVFLQIEKYIRTVKESELKKVNEQKVLTYYFDTADEYFKRNESAFRIRKSSAGANTVLSIKSGRGNIGAAALSRELNFTLKTNDICNRQLTDEDIIRLLQDEDDKNRFHEMMNHAFSAKSKEMRLFPILKIDMDRKNFFVASEKYEIDISFDSCKLKAVRNGREIEFFEMELELIKGNDESLLSMGKELRERFGLLESKESKYKRGLDLLG